MLILCYFSTLQTALKFLNSLKSAD